MTLLWFDGFGSYQNYTDMLAIYDSAYTHMPSGVTTGRNAGMAVRFDSSSGQITKSFEDKPQTLIAGVAFRVSSVSSISDPGVTDYQIFKIEDDANNKHLFFHFIPGGAIEVVNSSNVALATSDSGLLAYDDVWYYIEIKATISNTVGQITVKLNEIEVINTTANLDTCNGSNEYAYLLRVGEINGSGINYFSDFYVCDDSGSTNNDFLGDIRVDVLRPDGAGTYTDFTPSAGANYENVDEAYPNDDTTYNDSQDVAAGEQDSYAMESLDVLGTTIHGVKDQITVRKTDSGHREVKMLTIQGGSDYLGDTIVLSDSYVTHARIMEDNPDDAAAFVEADITAGEVGVEVTV